MAAPEHGRECGELRAAEQRIRELERALGKKVMEIEILAGTNVSKMGRKTGWTRGNVTHTCQHLNAAPDVHHRCQDKVAAVADTGDSGSPVFYWYSEGSGSNQVTLYGILWAKDGSGSFVYSHMGHVKDELGPLLFNDPLPPPPPPPPPPPCPPPQIFC